MEEKIEFNINVKTIDGKVFSLKVVPSDTVHQVKQKLEEQLQIPADLQRLIYSGHILDNSRKISELDVSEGCTFHMVRSKPPVSSTNTTATTNTVNTNSTTWTPQSSDPSQSNNSNSSQGMNQQQRQQQQNFGGMAHNLGLGGLNFSAQDMENVMQSPMFQSFLNNQDFFRLIVENNPQIRSLVESNPELGHVLSDPETTRQIVQMMRNPHLMREMQRNADLAMSNLENHPEGFRALSNLYHTLEEPLSRLFNPADEQSESTIVAPPSNETATSPNTSALPNPWVNSTNTSIGSTGTTSSTGEVNSGTNATNNNNNNNFNNIFGSLEGGDIGSYLQLMQNPSFQNLFQSVLSNPELFQNLISSNPYTQQFINNNPQLRNMISDPECLRNIANLSVFGRQNANTTANTSTANRGNNNINPTTASSTNTATNPSGNSQTSGGQLDWGSLDNLLTQMMTSNLLFRGAPMGTGIRNEPNYATPNSPIIGGNTTGSANTQSTAASTSNQPPQERFSIQLTQLKEMGFYDEVANINALVATNGNVNAAVERLLTSPY